MNKMVRNIFLLFVIALLIGGCSFEEILCKEQNPSGVDNCEKTLNQNSIESAVTRQAVPKPPMLDKPIKWTPYREELMSEYARIHYGKDIKTIVPKVVISHWTVSDDWESVYNYFYNERMPEDGGSILNVTSHYLVDKDGTIYQLTPETAMNRHAIGYNWCAIGIENVGGVDGKEDLTEAQLKANLAIIRYLADKYPTIEYVWGHYQQYDAKESGLYIELVPDYDAEKIDPGPIFMRGLKEGLKDVNLKFY